MKKRPSKNCLKQKSKPKGLARKPIAPKLALIQKAWSFLAVWWVCLLYSSMLQIDEILFSDTSLRYQQNAGSYIPEERTLQNRSFQHWNASQCITLNEITSITIWTHINFNNLTGWDKAPWVMKLRQLVPMVTQWIPQQAAAGQIREHLQIWNVVLGRR